MADYNRYKMFNATGTAKLVPFVKIPKSPTDKYTTFIEGRSRLDLISYQFYGDANYGWLIMQANPELGSLEYAYPDGARVRIPYPLEDAIANYEQNIRRYDTLYGIN